jgi:putative endonuclease
LYICWARNTVSCHPEHRRAYEHQHRLVPGFTSKYFLERLVYFEESDDIGAAIACEKELKAGAARRESP